MPAKIVRALLLSLIVCVHLVILRCDVAIAQSTVKDQSYGSSTASGESSSPLPDPVSSLTISGSSTAGGDLYADTPALRGVDQNYSPIILKNRIQQSVFDKPFTLEGAVRYADENYPSILKSRAQSEAAKSDIKVQKLNEYMPDSLFQYQDIMASHNKLAEVFYGSPVFPAVSGPGTNKISMAPVFYSGGGFSLDWAPLDFGLHKSRINLVKSHYTRALAQQDVTKFDVEVATASAFLDVVEALEQVRAAEENVASFSQFRTVVEAQVKSDLKPGADASLAEAQLANATNQVLRARLNREISLANLANAIGAGGREVNIDPFGFVAEHQPPMQLFVTPPLFENVPLLRASRAAVDSTKAQRKVLDKEYFPVFHFLGGFQTRSSGLSLDGKRRQSQGGAGIFPVIPNYQVALIINWNFLDYFRIKAEKKVQDYRIIAQEQDYNQILQNLQTEDVTSRAKIRTAIQLAANMPVQVKAASTAVDQAQARYKAGLGSVAQVAEATQVLAQSRMQEAIARVGIWRALLSVSSVRGDLKPFIAEARRAQTKSIQ